MTSSQMMLFGGGPPPVTFVGRAISQYTTSNAVFGLAIAGDTTGNIYTAGYNQTTSRVLIASFSSSGGYNWQRQLAPASVSAIGMDYRSITIDASNNIYVSFWVRNAAGTIDTGFLVKYNSAGTIQWQRQLTATSNTVNTQEVYIEPGGANVYVCGSCTISGNQAFHVVKYNSSGTLQWQRQLTGGSSNTTYDIHVDSSSNVYLAGQTNRGTAQFDGYIAKYNSSGTLQWQRQFTYGVGQGQITSITTDSSLNVYAGNSNPVTMMWKLTSAGATTFQQQNNGYYLPYRGFVCDSTNVFGNTYIGTNDNLVSAISTSTGAVTWMNRFTQASVVFGGAAFGSSGYLLATSRGVSGSDVYGGHFRVPTNGANTGAGSISASPINTVYSVAPNTGTITSTSFTNSAGAHTDAAGSLTSATSSLTDSAASNGNNTATF